MQACSVCKKRFPDDELYEYRGAFACELDFDQAIKNRDYERAEVIAELNHKSAPFEGLSFGDSVVGRANRQLLKPQIEIARKESMRVKQYERPAPNQSKEEK
jgi:hypothetical protein